MIGTGDPRREELSSEPTERRRCDINAKDLRVSDHARYARICTRGPCPTPRVSITLMRYIPGRGRAKVRVCISRKDANEPGRSGNRKVLHQLSACSVRTQRIYRRVHKLSSHYRSPRNTLYPCKTVKTNAVPTTKMLRRRLYARSSGTSIQSSAGFICMASH